MKIRPSQGHRLGSAGLPVCLVICALDRAGTGRQVAKAAWRGGGGQGRDRFRDRDARANDGTGGLEHGG